MCDEGLLSLLQGDGVHDRLALDALQSGLDDLPLGRVDHEGDAGNIRFGSAEVQEAHHRGLAVEHALVHVDIDNLRTVLDLGAADVECLFVLLVENQALENRGTRDIGALADIDEQAVVTDVERFEPRQTACDGNSGERAWRLALDRLGDRPDVLGRRTAATADDIDEA